MSCDDHPAYPYLHLGGAEDFVYLLREPLLNYGGEIVLELFRSALPKSHQPPKPCLTRPPDYDEAIRSRPRSAGPKIYERKEDAPRMPNRQPTAVQPTQQQPTTASPPPVKPPATSSQNRNEAPSSSSFSTTDDAAQRQHISSLKTNLTPDDPSILPWSSIAGLTHAKAALEEFAAVFFHFGHLVAPLRHASLTGVLLFGPQGTGKTLLVKSFAAKFGFAFYDVRASAIMSKYLGDSEKFVKVLFEEVKRNEPAVLLLDECDGLLCDPKGMDAAGGQSYRLLQNELKNQWSDLIYSKSKVMVVGATNKPGDIDMDGFGRRLSLKLHIDLPDADSCRQVLREGLAKVRHHVRDDADLLGLGQLCAELGLSGFDLDCIVEGLVRRGLRRILNSTHFKHTTWEGVEAVIPCDEEDLEAIECGWKTFEDQEKLSYRPLEYEDLANAIVRARPTVDASMIAKHEAFANLYCTEASD